MATLQEILARAQALREETALGSIDPERAGSIMYDTLQVINQMQLNGGALVITKIYASVAAMEADDAPVSDLTGNALKPGQLVVIVTTDTSSSDFGSVYRFDGIEDSASTWSFTGKIGGYPMDETPTEGSTRAVTSGGVYSKVSQLQETEVLVYEYPLFDWVQGSLNSSGVETASTTRIRTGFLGLEQFRQPLKINCAEGYGYRIFEYNASNAFKRYQSFDNGGLNTYTIVNAETTKIRFCLLKKDGGDIVPADAAAAKFQISRLLVTEDIINGVKDELTVIDFTVTKGQYYNGSHTTATQENWSILSPIDVSEYIGHKYRIRAFCPASQSGVSWFEDVNRATLESIRSDKYNVISGVIPQNAKFLYISNRWASFATPTVWIDTIGIPIATKEYVNARIPSDLRRNNLVGAKVSFLGDSITAGYYASDAAHRYCNLFCEKYDAIVNNLGVASTCIANNTLNSMSSQRFVTRATSANLTGSKLIVVFGGTNDFSYDSKAIGDLFAEETITPDQYIGNKKKVAVTDTDTFAGALHDLITTIRTNCPKVPIVFITPLKRGRYNTGRPTSKESNQWGDFLDDFCKAIKEICAFYSIPVLDANSISELDFSDSAISTEYSTDGLHPNDKGHAVLAELLYRFVEDNVVVL